jgi:predicted LPLAT superfamily acyltransferase
MKQYFYRFLTAVSNILGPWVFVLLSRGVAVGYFILFPARVKVGVRFYRALFPEKSRIFHLAATFRQFQNFTSVFLDRFLLQTGHEIRYTFEGRHHLIELLEEDRGGIILMSHMGNWEIAAHLLLRSIPQLPLMLLMGQRAKDEIERLQKDDLQASGIRIIAVDEIGGSPFSLVEGMSFLKTGGFVSLTGDLIWHDDQPRVDVDFLGGRAELPETPHALALVSGAPLLIFFASRRKHGQYHFQMLPPLYVRAASRDQRRAAIGQSAQDYADRLQDQLTVAPFEWYHFEPFLKDNVNSHSPKSK